VETITAVGLKNPGAQAKSLGVILADKTVLHKYLNPNMISIATSSPPVKGFSTLSVRYDLVCVVGFLVL